MSIKAESDVGPYGLLHVAHRLAFSNLPELQYQLSRGIRAGKIRWCLDLSDTEEITPAVTSVLVAVAGGLRNFGGDLVLFRSQIAGDRIFQDLELNAFFRIVTSLQALASESAAKSASYGKRAEMEDALLLFRGERQKERVRREDAPLHPGLPVEVFDQARAPFAGRLAALPTEEGQEEMIIEGLDLRGWKGSLDPHTVLSVRFMDGRYVYDNFGVSLREVRDDGSMMLGVPPFFLRSDQRLHQRVELDLRGMALPCDLAVLRKPYDVRVVNLSLSGCILRTEEHAPAGMLLSLAFENVELSGKIVRTLPEGKAVGFFGMDYGTRRRLFRLTKYGTPSLTEGRRGRG